jgi:hypothetical protein
MSRGRCGRGGARIPSPARVPRDRRLGYWGQSARYTLRDLLAGPFGRDPELPYLQDQP